VTATAPTFTRLNDGWNAEPNAPHPKVAVIGTDVLLEFFINPFRFRQFDEEDSGIIRFFGCARYRLGGTNDEGWYRGQCRYSKVAPAWGEFYEISGPDPLLDKIDGWRIIDQESNGSRHFLFYLRDHTFECIAERWEASSTNPKLRHLGAG
jgi:hypothetical protein